MNTIIGHPGTLDSFATSLLTIDIDRQQATRKHSTFMALSKDYVEMG